MRAWHHYGCLYLVILGGQLHKNWVLLLWAVAPPDLALCSGTLKHEGWAEMTASFSSLWPFSGQSPYICITFVLRGRCCRVTAVGAIKCFSGVGMVQRPLCWACLPGWLSHLITDFKSSPNLHNLGQINCIALAFGKIPLWHLSSYWLNIQLQHLKFSLFHFSFGA